MSLSLIVAASGLAAGALHVAAGPDHLAAVAPLAAQGGGSAWRPGVFWAVGHSSGVLLVGLVTLAIRNLIPLEALSSISDRIVGLALIGVGIWGCRRALRLRVHVHVHSHDGVTHSHVHVHEGAATHMAERHDAVVHHHVHASFLFGVLHGFAGSSHIFGVLPALALPSRAAAVEYLLSYAVGTIVAMSVFSVLVSATAHRARRHGLPFYEALLYTCSVAAAVIGGVWLIA